MNRIELEGYLNEKVTPLGNTLIENWPTLQGCAITGSQYDGVDECIMDGMKVTIENGKWVVSTIQ
jgi:hypothetical protein